MKRGRIILLIISIIFVIFFINLVQAPLPTVGGDTNTWGDILNEYLLKEHNADGTHGNISVNDIIVKSGPWLDVRAYGATGDGVTDDTAAIQAALNNASVITRGAIVFMPAGDYLVTSTLRVYAGVTLQGAGPGSPNNPGTKLIAASGFTGPVIGTYNGTAPNYYSHWTVIKDLQVNAANQTSGDGIWLRRIGELATIDRVEVSSACSNGIAIEGESTPVVLGYLSVMGNGRCGNGSGVYINGSQYTNNYIEYISGDNNYDALLKVNYLYRANLYLGGFKAERTNASTMNQVIWLENGGSGNLIIGSGKIHFGGLGGNGSTVLYNTKGTSSIGRFVVLGGIYYDTSTVNYSWYYASDDSTTPNKSFINLNGRPFYQSPPYFEAGNSSYALELEGALKMTSGVIRPASGFGNGIRFVNQTGGDMWELTSAGENNETLYFSYVKNNAIERWMSFFDSLYSPSGLDQIIFAPGNVSLMTLIAPSIAGGMGRVGIGTMNPVSRLEVNGTLTINTTTLVPLVFAKNTTTLLCNSTNAGGIFYSDKHYGCNGTTWNALY